MSNSQPAKLDPAQQKILHEYEEMLKKASLSRIEKAPEHLKELGKILRSSVEKGSLAKLRRFLKEHDVIVPRSKLEAFRDYLILNRIDLKDLEPDARARLRERYLSTEDPTLMSRDYREASKSGSVPRCRDCRWFVTPPNDGEEGSDKACVEFGTKGADKACYGFTLKPS